MPQVKENCLKAIRDLEGDWDIEITPHEKQKTASQRGTFHWLCGILGDRLGISPGDIKMAVKGKYFGWKTVRFAGMEFPIADGSSEDLKRVGYAQLIDTLYQLAAEAGERLPEPDPLRGRR